LRRGGRIRIYLTYRLKHYFTDFALDIYEKNPGIGGTWLGNRYPGCACDVLAHNYTYSFEPKWDWSANYAGSEEIFKNFSEAFWRPHRFTLHSLNHHPASSSVY
jgi:cation diffusion facilitator CzcD-associated flavoprotein CzcO